jgi:hypothetical protein
MLEVLGLMHLSLSMDNGAMVDKAGGGRGLDD